MSTRVHYVVLESPGTLFSEQTKLPVEFWDVAKAVQIAKGITERHGANMPGGQ